MRDQGWEDNEFHDRYLGIEHNGTFHLGSRNWSLVSTFRGVVLYQSMTISRSGRPFNNMRRRISAQGLSLSTNSLPSRSIQSHRQLLPRISPGFNY